MNEWNKSIRISGISSNFDWLKAQLNDKAEATQMYVEAEGWALVDGDTPKEDTSQDWQIKPFDTVDPDDQGAWKDKRLWMTDHMDGMIGDDAMPSLCSSCNGVFWGDEMVSIRKTVHRLCNKHSNSINSVIGSVWKEVEDNIINKLRSQRICKKCFLVGMESRANPWDYNYDESIYIPAQQQLPFNGSSSISPSHSSITVPTCTASGMAISSDEWTVSYTDMEDDYMETASSDDF